VLSAKYLRSQAQLCLEMAQQMSNSDDAQRLRINAAEHFTRAVDAEAQSGVDHTESTNDAHVPTRFYFCAEYDGIVRWDEQGQSFPTLQKAEEHAHVVADELSRNTAKRVSVSVVDERGAVLMTVPGSSPSAD